MTAKRLTSYHQDIRVERDHDVTTVTIDRPESKNGCTGDMWVALGAVFRDVGTSKARAVVLTGAAGNFCTGADLSGTRDSSAAGSGGRAPSGNKSTPRCRLTSSTVLSAIWSRRSVPVHRSRVDDQA